MALRAGYFGLKRFEKNKLSVLAASMPADIGPDNPIVGKNDVLATVDLMKDTTGWIGGNLFNGKSATKTGQGITWTVNESDNNIVTVSGTPTGFEPLTIDSNNVLPVGEYVLSGISDMVNVVYNGVFLYKNNTVVRDLNIQDDRSAHTISILQSDDYDTICVQLKRQTNGVACSGTGKIMITTPEQYALNPSYRPYHESVEEMLTPKLLTSADDLDDVKTGGDYYWTQSYPTHSPENNTFGALRVLPCGEVIHQMVVRGAGSSASIYIRRFQETWSSWYKFSGTELIPENETKKATKKKVIKEEEE